MVCVTLVYIVTENIDNFGQIKKLVVFFFNQPLVGGGLVNHTRRVCPEGVKRPQRVPVEKRNEATILA